MKPEQAAIAVADSRVAGKVAEDLLRSALLAGAHSVHLEPSQDLARVRYRIDGLLHEWGQLSHNALQALVAHFKHRANLNLEENRWSQEGTFTLNLQGQEYQVRISTLPLTHGEKMVLKMATSRHKAHSLASLGVWGTTRTHFNKALTAHQGLIVVSGTHHGGVSTTLGSALSALNHPSRNIVSIADPIEHRIPGIHNMRINRQQGIDFTHGLQAALATEANTIALGDLHSRKITNGALNAAAKGKLIVAGMHAGSMEQTLRQLAALSDEQFLLASGLRAVMYQKLVRRLCDSCKVAAKPDAATLKRLTTYTRITVGTLQAFMQDMQQHHSDMAIQLYAPRRAGCITCHYTGFRGQIGLFELFDGSSPTLQRRIAHHADPLNMLHQAVREGMMPLLIDGFVKALCGLTTIDEVLKSYKRI